VDKAVTTALLIIAGVVCMVFVFNSVYPMVNRSSQAVVTMADTMDDRMKSRVSIVHAASSADRQTVYLWVKNIGSSRIVSIDDSDLFFGQEDDFSRVSYTDDAGGSYPYWEYEFENGTEWRSGVTVKITITYNADPGSGTYYAKFIIPNGISDEYYFSM